MSLTVNTASTSNRLTTLEAVKRELELGSTELDNDKYIWDLIHVASDWIESYCNRKFAKETITEKIQSRGSAHIMVSRTPLKSVSFIEEDGSSISSTTYEIEDEEAGIIYREKGFEDTILHRQEITKIPTRFGRKDWKVKYEGGYSLPGSSDRDLPYDVERACIELIKANFFQKNEDPNVVSQEVGDAKITRYAAPGGQVPKFNFGVPPTVIQTLKPWVRHEVTPYS